MRNLNTMALNMDANQAIFELPYLTLHKLSRLLDGVDTQTNWRGLIAVIPDQIYDDIEIEHFALEIQRYGKSPSMALLRDLGNRGRTVKQLISYLDKMHHERALMLLKRHEKLRILQQPKSIAAKAGAETAVLACKAKGFPYPKYQWYKAFAMDDSERQVTYEEAENGNDRVFKISPVTAESAGAYCCQVYHVFNSEPQQVFTEWAYLKVLPAPEEETQNTPVSDQPLEKPVILKQPSSVSAQSGRPVKLECQATGCPAPRYQWHKMGCTADGQLEPFPVKDQVSSELYWAQATKDDNGQYCCLVSNDAGRVWSCTIDILIGPQVSAQGKEDTIEIIRHPQSVTCAIGEAVTLACNATVSGQSSVLYQWFKDQKEIPGSTNPELLFNAVKPEECGKYQCRVSNTFTAVWSHHATVDMQGARPGPQMHQFVATDKVALLIGNQDYRCAQKLSAPEGDVGRLSNVLYSDCAFKTVTLLNLTLEEMHFALQAFCELLNKGVYGLFYFSGHGFESDGQSYLVPVDAGAGYSTEECMCAQQVLDLMQNRETALNVLLLDICRKANDYSPHASKRYMPQVKGNTVFGYAAQYNSQAWEVKGKPYGIFTEYLIKRITQHKKVSLVIEDVMEDVSQDEDAKEVQFPALSSDLRESRSLMDMIQFRGGHTMEYCERTQLWTEAHELPVSPMWKDFPNYGVRVGIMLSAAFSNIIDIDVFVADCGTMETCTAQLEEFSSRLDISVDSTTVNLYNPEAQKSYTVPATKTNVRHLQRLQGDLTATLLVKCTTKNGDFVPMKLPFVVEKPLVSKLWQTRHYALPSEECFPDSTSASYEEEKLTI